VRWYQAQLDRIKSTPDSFNALGARSGEEECELESRCHGGGSHGSRFSRCLTFELTPRAEAGTVSRDGDDGSAGAGPAYSACRSESGVERGVLRHRASRSLCLGQKNVLRNLVVSSEMPTILFVPCR